MYALMIGRDCKSLISRYVISKSRFAKPLQGQKHYRGFESPSLRHKYHSKKLIGARNRCGAGTLADYSVRKCPIRRFGSATRSSI